MFFAVLLIFNFWISSRATQPAARVRVPYSPFFLNEVKAGDVVSITSKGTAIQGMFKKADELRGLQGLDRFQTEIPAFADTKSLSNLLEEKKVVVNAKPLTGSIAVVGEPARRLRPDDPVRRAARAADAPRRERAGRCSARSAARARAATSRPAIASRSTTSPGSTRPRQS